MADVETVHEKELRDSNPDSEPEDSFQDASNDQIKPESPNEPSRSRSLTGNRTSSTTQDSNSSEEPTTNGTGVHDEEEDEDEETSKPKSPLLTSHRISATESLDNVNLGEDQDSQVLPKVPAKGICSSVYV
jgi:hypothetical protein